MQIKRKIKNIGEWMTKKFSSRVKKVSSTNRVLIFLLNSFLMAFATRVKLSLGVDYHFGLIVKCTNLSF